MAYPGARRRALALALLLILPLCGAQRLTDPQAPVAVANDNRTPSGHADSGTTAMRFEVREAIWFPEGQPGPNLKVFAFAEEGKPPQIPGPLIRVREGTEIRISVRNFLNRTVTIHGLGTHTGDRSEPLILHAGEIREETFASGAPGTYAYWASAGAGMWQGRTYKEDSQLAGAFVVDAKDGPVSDRVFVLTAWRDRPQPNESLDVAAINGKSWPYTERLTYTAGDSIHWRVLNLSSLLHPMHLHGGYFDVLGTGNGERYELLGDARRTVSTELLQLGRTMDMTWTAERTGRWLFHCHTLPHVTPDIMLFHQNGNNDHQSHSAANHMDHMSGMVLGITVKPSNISRRSPAKTKPERILELVVGTLPGGRMGYGLVDPKTRSKPVLSAPGPPLVLTRGEPVEIRVINRLSEPTTVHWHGIELDSYYDGVAGWTGEGKRVTPFIPPGKTFSARFTPLVRAPSSITLT